MNKEDKQATIERYNERISKFGHNPRALGWNKGRQPIRFDTLTQIGELKDCSLLDLGCGFGDLYPFLKEFWVNVDYTGYDINPNLIEMAKKAHPDARFEVKDIQEEEVDRTFDWVIASGVFNYKLQNNHVFTERMLKRMFELCNKGVACDFLSTYVDFFDTDAHYTSPIIMFRYCKILSKRVTLRHDYMPYEFCVYIYKDDEIDENNVFTRAYPQA